MNPPVNPNAEIMTPPSQHTLFDDHEQRFACQDCPAKCCRYPWNIIITPEEHQQYLATDWIVQKLHDDKVEMTQFKNNYTLPRTRKKDGSMSCVFLNDDNLCSIQVKEGHDLLPYTCQSYPFSFNAFKPMEGQSEESTLPKAKLSFFCKSIQSNYGDPVDQKVKFKYKKAKEANRVQFMPPTVILGKQLTLPDSTYVLISTALDSLFEDPSVPVSDALWQGRMLLEDLIDAHEPGQTATLASVKKVVDRFSPDKVQPKLSELPCGTLVGKTVLALKLFGNVFFALQEDFPKNPNHGYKKRNDQLLLLQMFFDLLIEKGEYPFWGLSKWIDLAAAKKIRMEEHRPEFQAMMRRYYQQFFISNSLFYTVEDILKGYFVLGATYPYMLRIARFHAYTQGRDEVNETDLAEAIGYADLLSSTIGVQSAHTFIFEMKEKILTLIAFRLESLAKVLRSESD